MQIIWYGQSCFQLIFSRRKEEKITFVIDPFSTEIGLRLPKIEADVLLVTHSHNDHSNVKGIPGDHFLINGPGEYEIKGIFIQGIECFHDEFQGKERGKTTTFIIEGDEMKLCHLGDFGQKELTPDQLEKIGNVDILMIPVGGVYTISAQEASRVISQIEPKIVIPMHYYISNLKIKLDNLDKFLKVMGVKSTEVLNKLIIKKGDLSEDGMQIKVLNP
ncbi:MBL fold metallo-hydrolase [Patescibacteria group bacterium]|nr:MBL fold metallo-hydrolase [Patescibacteria group bacterium]